MPPPRLLRPLRPWHPPRTSARARCLSNGPRDGKKGRRDGGDEPEQPATEVNADADTPAAGWVRGVTSRVSGLVAKPPLPPSPPKPPMPAPATTPAPPEGQLRAHGPPEPNSPPSDTGLVSHEVLGNPAKSRQHVSGNVESQAHDSTEVVGSSSGPHESHKKPKSSSEGKRKKGKDPEPKFRYYYQGLKPHNVIRKHIRDKPESSEIRARRDAIAKGKIAPTFDEALHASLGPTKTYNTTLKTTQTQESAAGKEEPLFKERQSLTGKKDPTVSFTQSEDNIADLSLQLQYLVDQVRLLNEKIAASSTSKSEVLAANLNVTQTSSPRTTQATNTPTGEVANSQESTLTVPLQSLENAEVPSASSQSSTDVPAQSSLPTASLPTIDQNSNPALVRRYGQRSQAKLQNEKIKTLLGQNVPAQQVVSASPSETLSYLDKSADTTSDGQRLMHDSNTQGRAMKYSDHVNVDNGPTHPVETPAIEASSTAPLTQAPMGASETSEQSLLDELFPEASSYVQPHYSNRNPYPRLDPPSSAPIVRTYTPKEKLSNREKYIQAFQRSAEKMTALQLLHCSTELTEADFRRLVPKGRHIEGWARDGDFHQVIPGRDPLSLERLPFYYLIFKNTEAALRYQNNAVRLYKLSKLHGPSSPLSAIPPPPGFLENGEDINAALSSYLLTPTSQNLQLNLVVQPYNPALARLIEDGGYAPIVPSKTPEGKPIYKVLFYIEGYEPSPYDLYQIFMQDASARGLTWPFLHEHLSVRRLRDVVDLKTRFLPVSANNPRASTLAKRKLADMKSHDPYTSFLRQDASEDDDPDAHDAKAINQVIMNRVYNRWVVEFSEEAGARRFARLWHRKVLPMQDSVLHRTWRDVEVRTCNAEYLW